MKHSATLMLFVVGCLLLGACKSTEMASEGTASAALMTMEQQLIAKYIEASGGMEALGSIQSVRMEGEVYMPMAGMDMPLTITVKRPGKLRADVKVPAMNLEVVQGYDGETAWADNPMQGGLQKVTGDQVRQFKEQADIDGFLVNPEAKGYTIEYVGEAEINGTPTEKLRVMRADSSELFVYLDAETFLQVKTEGDAPNQMTGGMSKVEAFMSDYRPINGVPMPHSMEVKTDGQVFQTITFSKITANVEIDDTIFMYPKK